MLPRMATADFDDGERAPTAKESGWRGHRETRIHCVCSDGCPGARVPHTVTWHDAGSE